MNKPFVPMRIGGLALRNNLIAAPMAGLSSLPYRMLAMECGCSLAMSEMVSSEGASRAHERTRRYFANDDRVRPFGVQIFGASPDAVAQAIGCIDGEPFDLIDINMGCPVKKVVSKGAGSALMRTPKLAEKLIRTARAATKTPLTVKIRAGWDDSSINCVEFALMAQECGVDALTIHPRTRMQEFRGRSDWRLIAAVKQALAIPVIGNGDVVSREDALRMLCETGCDGVMIGRAAMGNPWIFSEVLDPGFKTPDAPERGRMAARHLEMLCGFVGEKIAVLNMRTLLPCYGKGLRGIRKFMQRCHAVTDARELTSEILSFFSDACLPESQASR